MAADRNPPMFRVPFPGEPEDDGLWPPLHVVRRNIEVNRRPNLHAAMAMHEIAPIDPGEANVAAPRVFENWDALQRHRARNRVAPAAAPVRPAPVRPAPVRTPPLAQAGNMARMLLADNGIHAHIFSNALIQYIRDRQAELREFELPDIVPDQNMQAGMEEAQRRNMTLFGAAGMRVAPARNLDDVAFGYALALLHRSAPGANQNAEPRAGNQNPPDPARNAARNRGLNPAQLNFAAEHGILGNQQNGFNNEVLLANQNVQNRNVGPAEMFARPVAYRGRVVFNNPQMLPQPREPLFQVPDPAGDFAHNWGLNPAQFNFAADNGLVGNQAPPVQGMFQ